MLLPPSPGADEGTAKGLKAPPPLDGQVHNRAHVNGNGPRVGKVPINDFAHDTLLLIQVVWVEVQDDIEHGALSRQTSFMSSTMESKCFLCASKSGSTVFSLAPTVSSAFSTMRRRASLTDFHIKSTYFLRIVSKVTTHSVLALFRVYSLVLEV